MIGLRKELRAWLADRFVWWAFRLDPERFIDDRQAEGIRRLEESGASPELLRAARRGRRFDGFMHR